LESDVCQTNLNFDSQRSDRETLGDDRLSYEWTRRWVASDTLAFSIMAGPDTQRCYAYHVQNVQMEKYRMSKEALGNKLQDINITTPSVLNYKLF